MAGTRNRRRTTTAVIAVVALLALVLGLILWWRSTLLPPPLRDTRGIPVPGGVVEVYALQEFQSNEGETLHAFLARVGRFLVDYSDRTGFEACGGVCEAKDQPRWHIAVSTNRAQTACAYRDACADGYVSTKESIHSHATPGSYKANRVDAILSGGVLLVGKRYPGGPLDEFSLTDLRGAPGYLAAPTGLYHQRGPGTQRKLEDVAPSTVAAAAP